MQHSFDIIVIGGGHAGCEAAAAAARSGASTALVTLSAETIGVMSCNPAIGGLGKGHLVREIDALDGLMGRVADAAGIQFRLLNRRKAPAVRGPRTQADRKLYRQVMRAAIEAQSGLDIVEGEIVDLAIADGTVAAVVLADGRNWLRRRGVDDRDLPARAHPYRRAPFPSRPDEREGIDRAFPDLFAHRVQARSAEDRDTAAPRRPDHRLGRVDMQAADDEPSFFSLMTDRLANRQISCGVNRTTAATHDLIRANLGRSAMYSGSIEGVGPRYCPSIEDKIVKFGDRDGHQIFLEPEGLDDDTVYPNGISTSLPEEVQLDLLKPSRPRTGEDAAARLRDRVRSCRSARTDRDLGKQAALGPFFGWANQRHDRLRGGGSARHRCRHQCRAQGSRAGGSPSAGDAYIGVLIDDLTGKGITEPIACSRLALNSGCRCAPTMPTSA